MADARARRHRGGATEIADDILREALARLTGLQELIRCAATCRRWRRLVTHRAFLRRVGHWPDTARRPCFLAGIFSQNEYPVGPARPPGMKKPFHTPPQFLSLQAGGGTRLTFDSFVASGDDALFDLARPLASRRGFLLAHVFLPGDNYGHPRLAVCRPLLDKRSTRVLPPPPFGMTEHYWHSSLIGCAILTGADHVDADDGTLDHKQTSMFQVLVIYINDNGFVCACTYSADTGRWSAPVHCCRASGLIRCGPRAGVVTRGGTVHWLFMDEINQIYYSLSISTVRLHVSLTEIPIKVHARPPIPCIAGEGRSLSFVTIRDRGVAELWTKQEQSENDSRGCKKEAWQCSKLVDLGSRRIDIVFIAETRGALLVKQGGAFSVVDLKTKERTALPLEEEGTEHVRGTTWFVGSCSSTYCRGHPGWMCRHIPPVLYEMDWVFNHPMASQRVNS